AVDPAQVRTDDHADVVQFQALAGVDAADLFDRVRGDDPEAAVLVEVPLGAVAVFGDLDVPGLRVLPAVPVPAVAGDHAGLVVGLVLLPDQLVQLHRGVDDAEVEGIAVEVGICRLADAKEVVQPGDVAVRAGAAELRGQLQVGDLGAHGLGPVLQLGDAADVGEGD